MSAHAEGVAVIVRPHRPDRRPEIDIEREVLNLRLLESKTLERSMEIVRPEESNENN